MLRRLINCCIIIIIIIIIIIEGEKKIKKSTKRFEVEKLVPVVLTPQRDEHRRAAIRR